jgi:hypothetical protein
VASVARPVATFFADNVAGPVASAATRLVGASAVEAIGTGARVIAGPEVGIPATIAYEGIQAQIAREQQNQETRPYGYEMPPVGSPLDMFGGPIPSYTTR